MNLFVYFMYLEDTGKLPAVRTICFIELDLWQLRFVRRSRSVVLLITRNPTFFAAFSLVEQVSAVSVIITLYRFNQSFRLKISVEAKGESVQLFGCLLNKSMLPESLSDAFCMVNVSKM